MGGSSGVEVPGVLAPEATLRYLPGTYRTRTPAETVDLVRERFDEAGITRIADVTGLDRIGIPIVMVVRPNSRSLAVSQGKGTDLDSATASGVMEAIELHLAERPELALRATSYHQLRREGARVPDPERLPLARESTFGPDHTTLWAPAVEILSGEPMWVPYELVHADASYPLVPGSGGFVRSTNGLASGNCLSEALLHALTELVERDCLALWECASEDQQEERRIDPASIDTPAVRALLDRYDSAGIDVVLWDMTTEIGIPAVRAIIVDRDSDEVLRPMPAAFGAGCHPDGEVALVRALTEAAQSRLTAIAGSRDDLTRARYRSFQHAEALALARELARRPGGRPAGALTRHSGTGPASDVTEVVDRLASSGFGEVAAVDLTPPGWPVRVARAIVPGLEGPTESRSYRPGPRARAMATGAR